jgi:hypothetical protein
MRAKASDELVRRMLGLLSVHEFRSWSEIRKSVQSIGVDVPKTKPVEVGHPVQQLGVDQSMVYRLILETCQKSQETMDKRLKVAGPRGALAESEPYGSMWRNYTDRITKLVQLMRVSFSGLLFKNVVFENHDFIDCDFSRSRWIFSFIKKAIAVDQLFQI